MSRLRTQATACQITKCEQVVEATKSAVAAQRIRLDETRQSLANTKAPMSTAEVSSALRLSSAQR